MDARRLDRAAKSSPSASRRFLRIALFSALGGLFTGAAVLAQAAPGGTASLDETLPIPMSPWRGDLDGMAKRRVIRAAVVYSRMFYLRRPRGATGRVVRGAEALREVRQ